MPNSFSSKQQMLSPSLAASMGNSGGQSISGNSAPPTGRKTSIVEILSSPPPILQTPEEEIHSISLSRNTSLSSKASSLYASSGTAGAPTSISGIDWADIPLSELTESNKLISIHSGYSVKRAFETLVQHNLTSVPVSPSKTDASDLSHCVTFDYNDLNTYLLLMMNKINYYDLTVDEIGDAGMSLNEKHELIRLTINGAKHGEEVSVDFIIKLHPKNAFYKFNELESLFKAMETLGNGVHRVAITDSTDSIITGILSQRRLIKFMWENARRFPSLDFYLNSTLQDLKIGFNNPITIFGDQLLIEALHKMFAERVTSLAVVDRTRSLIGNISIVDVKNVSSSKNSHLLFKSTMGFIGYNLTLKGTEQGQDQYPIFHVNNQTSLGRVIAKLVATQSHRLWIVENRKSVHHSANSSGSNTSADIATGAKTGITHSHSPKPPPTTIESTLNQQLGSVSAGSGVAHPYVDFGLQGELVGVVTLTDILGLFAQTKSDKKIDPLFARKQRRRSSTSTTRSSFEAPTSNQEMFRKSCTASDKNAFRQ